MDAARYELLELLGRGGMGSVYAAVHRPSGRRLAIKIPHVLDGTGLAGRLLLREAAAAARLRHRSIVSLVDVVRAPDGRLALVMELVEGENLGVWAAVWPGWERFGIVLDDVLAGLARAHGAGIVHRDLKLENVLVTPDGHAKITDFGIAADLDVRGGPEGQQALGGTPLYMAPEQFDARGHIGPWTDLYACGVILHIMLTGEPPFDEDTVPKLIISKSLPRRSGSLERAGIPQELRRAIDSLLDPNPRRRPRFARELRKLLARLPLRDFPEPVRMEASPSQRHTTGARVSSLLTGLVHRTESSVPTLVSRPPATLPLPSSPSSEVPRSAAAAFAETQPSAPSAAPPEITERGDVPRWLPAPIDPDLGVAVARLRDPFVVGRRAERELIVDRIARVRRDKRSRLLGLVGPAGVGKSTLARWGQSLVEVEGRMEPLSTAYDAFGVEGPGLRHVISRILGPPPTGLRGSEWPSAWSWLRAGGDAPFDPIRVTRWLAGGEVGGSRASAEICFQVLSAAAKIRPVYLWLDDLGWAHDGAMELTELLLDAVELPVLIIATFRSGTLEHASVRAAIDRLRASSRVELHEIDNLSRDERVELLSSLAPLDPTFARELAARVDETTLVTVELLYDWISKGLLRLGAEGLGADRGLDELLAVRPPRAAVAARVEALLRAFGERAAVAEAVLTRAALLGVAFDELALGAACTSFDMGGQAVHEVLDRALLSGILRPEGREAYRFDHDALRAALAARLDERADRAQILAETGQGLIDAFGVGRPELHAHAASLLRQADPSSRAPWRYLSLAIAILGRGSALSAAWRHLELGRSWLANDSDDLDWKRAQLDGTEAFLSFYASDYANAEAALARATRAAHEAGDDMLLRRCATLEVELMLYQDQLGRASVAAERCLEELDQHGIDDPSARSMLHHALSEVACQRGDDAGSLHHAELWVRSAERHGGPGRSRAARAAVAERFVLMGQLDEAERRLREIEREADAAGDTGSALEIGEARMRYFAVRGAWEAIRAAGLERRAHEVESEGDRWRLTGIRVLDALVAAHLDDEAHAAWAAARFIGAFEQAHHDERLIRNLMLELASALEARGLTEQGARVRELHAERGRAIARGLLVTQPG